MAKTRREFTPEFQTRSGRPAGEQRPATDAGRGRAWDPALDAEAVACHAERGLTRAAVCWIDGRLATKPGCVPRSGRRDRPTAAGARPHAYGARRTKKSYRHLRGDAQVTFAFIEQHARTWPVRLMCRVLGVSPSGFYGWRSRPESARSASNRQLWTTSAHPCRHHRRYGAPTRACRSASRGPVRQPRGVERLMRRHGIRALAGRRFRPCTTDSRHDLPIAPISSRDRTSQPRDPTRSGWPISPTCRPARAGCTWPLSSIWPRARSSVGRCAITCAPS